MEKFVGIFAPILGFGLLLFLAISSQTTWGIFNNMYSRGCKAYGQKPIYKIVGYACWGIAVFTWYAIGYAQWFDSSLGAIVLGIFVPLCLSFVSFHGFNAALAPEDQYNS